MITFAVGLSCTSLPRLTLVKNFNKDFILPHLFTRSVFKKSSTVIFFQLNRKGTDELPKKLPFTQRFKIACKSLVPETKKYFKEQKENITRSPMLECEHGNYEVIFRFDRQSELDSWTVSTDSDYQGGKSKAELTFTKNRTGLFHGNICKEVPKDGITKYSGYANITAKTPQKSFFRDTHWDWSLFNCLVFKVRGDGRPYNIVLGCDFEYDVNWLTRWSFPLYTRGGPYWQISKVPFSRFYVSHHGRVQDVQEYPCLSIVNSIGLTLMDSAEGPFSLEIESIALMYDVNISTKHAYELYEDRNFESN